MPDDEINRRALEILERCKCDWVDAWGYAAVEYAAITESGQLEDSAVPMVRRSRVAPGRIAPSQLLARMPAPTAASPVLPTVMRSSESDGVDPAAAELVIRARRGGDPLDDLLRQRLEAALRTRLDSVRVHTGADASAAAGALGARAFAIGDDVFFRDGAYDPHSREGQRLIAHEVAHTVQTRGAAATSDTMTVSQRDDAPEREADAFADAFVRGIAADPFDFRFDPPDEQGARRERDHDEQVQHPADPDRAAVAIDGGARSAASPAPREADATGMPALVRAKMEHAFGVDFSQVRIHSESSRAVELRAQAFTLGNHVHVAPGLWAPQTQKGQELLGHELAHVLQQRAGRVAATRQMMGMALNDDSALEREADEMGVHAAAGQRVGREVLGHGAPGEALVQRLATDFEIRGKDPNAARFPRFIFFTQGSAVLDVAEQAKVVALATPTNDMLTLHGYASEEGAAAANAAMARARLAAAKTKLIAAGHNPLKITTLVEPSKGQGNIDYRHMRSVEVVRPGGVSSVPPAPASPPCAGADETAFVDAEAEAEAMITKATTELGGAIGPAMNGLLGRFFPGLPIAPTVRTNLLAIKTQLALLKPAARHVCGNASVPGCDGSEAFITGVGSTATMTLCQSFLRNPDKKDRGGTLIHEAAHGTPGVATDDKSYAHVRQIEFLSQADALKNSDSYTLLVRLFDTPGSMSVGVADALPGMTGPEQTAAKRSLAWLETWLVAAYQELASLYETIHDSIAAGAWTNAYYKNTMVRIAPIFGLTPPPAIPPFDDKVKVAAIHDRVHTMRETMHSTPVTITKGVADSWTPGPGASAVVSPAFFADTASNQLQRLLKAIVLATPDISAGFVPKYLDAIDKIRAHASVGSP